MDLNIFFSLLHLLLRPNNLGSYTAHRRSKTDTLAIDLAILRFKISIDRKLPERKRKKENHLIISKELCPHKRLKLFEYLTLNILDTSIVATSILDLSRRLKIIDWRVSSQLSQYLLSTAVIVLTAITLHCNSPEILTTVGHFRQSRSVWDLQAAIAARRCRRPKLDIQVAGIGGVYTWNWCLASTL